MGWSDEPRKDWMSSPYLVRARGQRHRDAPLSRRGRVLWFVVYGVVAVATIALITLGLLDVI